MKLPANHIQWVYYPLTEHYITSLKNNRDKYYLWHKGKDGNLEKIATASNPIALERKIK